MPAYKDTKRGTWYIKYSYTDRITGKRIQTFKRGFATKKEAQRWEAEQSLNQTQQTGITFRELDEKYIEFKNPRKESTREQERSRVNKYIPFADDPMTRIHKSDLMEWYTDLLKMEISVSVKNYLIGVVKAVFKLGHEFYGLPNEAAILKKLKKKAKAEDFDTWTPDEFDQFIQAVPDFHYRNIFTVMFWTGCRRGEAIALRKEDYTDGALHIYHQMKYEKDGFMELKTDSSERTIKVVDAVRAVLEPIQAELADNGYFILCP